MMPWWFMPLKMGREREVIRVFEGTCPDAVGGHTVCRRAVYV
jgi:hypothetical protein